MSTMNINPGNIKSPREADVFKKFQQLKSRVEDSSRQLMNGDDRVDIDFTPGKGNVCTKHEEILPNGNRDFDGSKLVYNPDTKEVKEFFTMSNVRDKENKLVSCELSSYSSLPEDEANLIGIKGSYINTHVLGNGSKNVSEIFHVMPDNNILYSENTLTF